MLDKHAPDAEMAGLLDRKHAAAPEHDGREDRGADEVTADADPGLDRLAHRMVRLEAHTIKREISWLSLAGLGTALIGVILLAWACNGH